MARLGKQVFWLASGLAPNLEWQPEKMARKGTMPIPIYMRLAIMILSFILADCLPAAPYDLVILFLFNKVSCCFVVNAVTDHRDQD